MVLEMKLPVNRKEILQSLGYGTQQPDEATAVEIEKAAEQMQQVVAPRWNWTRFDLAENQELKNTGVTLEGRDIEAHLAGCHACVLFCVTLGMAVEQCIRAAEAVNMQQAVLLDSSASVLVEQYADAAEQLLLAQALEQDEFGTGRYSPGYGDLPITLQPIFLRLLNAQRTTGLSVSSSGILLPRKSITAIIGVANHPVSGKLAGCANCALREKCSIRKSGKGCASIETSMG